MSSEREEESEKKGNDAKKAKMRLEFDSLHAEMEVANYAVNHQGRSRKKIGRQQSKVRTIKRKSLEVEDAKVSAVKTNQRKRMRGSRAALEDDVVQGSLIFGAKPVEDDEKSEGSDSDVMAAGEHDSDDNEGDSESDDEEPGRYNLYAEELNIDIDQDDSDSDDEERTPNKIDKASVSFSDFNSPASRVKVAPGHKYSGKKIAKTMYKLKNFKSFKMAQRHGEALGAHARGLNIVAVDKLKGVASAAPVAPQLYSSLGLVYESMLQEETEKAKRAVQIADREGFEILPIGDKSNSREKDPTHLKERVKLAKKTFGSYHVAALLCKMDYSLWTRAGDAALTIANLHSHCLIIPPSLDDEAGTEEGKEEEEHPEQPNSSKISTPGEYLRFHQAERLRWLGEAREDFQTADNLRPPGISVPSKLAYAQMELGNISEALTILTDLQSKSQKQSDAAKKEGKPRRTEMERSYTAWLLYADLMLIIGHECKQWNRGIHTNENYMFRRWLRKYSTAFDWQERRFQALCMALEAAAGSKACSKLMVWIRERTKEMKSKGSENEDESRWQVCDTYEMDRKLQEQKGTQDKGEVGEDDGTNDSLVNSTDLATTATNKIVVHSLSLDRLNKTFNEDRSALLSSHRDQLSIFDLATKDRISDSDALKDRDAERAILVTNHRQALVNLAVKYQEDKTRLLQAQTNGENKNSEVQEKGLPLIATCAIVTDIAAQLVKQCLAMNLHRAGTLACEAISCYLKERACRVETRMKKWKKFEERQEYNGKSVLQLDKEQYDTMADAESDGEDSVVILSDDEDFECPSGENILLILKEGILPPELQVLYGLCLLSGGNSAFLGVKMLSALHDLDKDAMEDFDLQASTSHSDSVSLRLFRRAMVEPMSKLDAFAFSSDILKKVETDGEWAESILPIFQGYIDELEQQKSFTLLKDATISNNIITSVKRGNCVKVLLSTLRMKIGRARNLSKSSDSSDLKDAYDSSLGVIDDIYLFKDALWTTTPDGNPISDTVEMLDILSSAFSVIIICLDPSDNNNVESLRTLIDKLKASVAIICQVDFHDLYSSYSSLLSESWRYFPIPSKWQSDEHSAMSRCAYNLSIASGVSSFSGWEKDEFTLDLLKRSRKDTFFGIHLQGKKVAGFLNSNRERHLSNLWNLIETLIPTLTSLDFENGVSNAKKVDWYKKAMENLENNFKDESIATFGEDSALNILFIFAHIALLLAKQEDDDVKEDALIKHALSIVLPPTQICLDQSLWDSELGVKGTDENAEWQIFAAGDSTFKASSHPIRRLKNNSTSKISLKAKQNAMKLSTSNQMTKSPFSKLIKISAEVMLREWNGKETFEDSDEDDDVFDRRLNKWSCNVTGPSKLAMKKLDYSIQKLRNCTTIISLQKASLQVSLSLLEVAGTKDCRNPFLCLSQAAIFSAQGPKGGSNDETLKKSLPKESDCTVEEALQILGRADCLRAIHFTNEAMFLCSYAVRVCCLHRDKHEVNHPWTPKWRIIGIMAYTISVGIDSLTCSIMQGEERKQTLDAWEKPVKAEIGRGRSDAIAMQKAFGRFNTSLARQNAGPSKGEDTIDNEEDDSSLKEDYDSGDQEGDDEGDSEDEQMDEAESQSIEQMDDAEGETIDTILESGMIEDQVMPALPPLPSAAVTPHSNGYAHISAVEI